MIPSYLESLHKQFAFYKMLGDKTFIQLKEKDLFWQINEQSNSIAMIVNHLWGNMMSRWTDFLTTDGEKIWRHRDEEFEDVIHTRKNLLKKWEEGWDCLFSAIAAVNEENTDTVIYIRNMGHTIPEAFNRQLGHYAYHTGQIVYIGKMIKGQAWKSLSIPKGESKAYNSHKFTQEKRKAHYTEEFLDQE
ncbi:MAG: DUF1572 family protein [Bacteroidota bacterium]